MDDNRVKAEIEKESIATPSIRCKFTRGFMWFFDAANLMLSNLPQWLLLTFAIALINMLLSFIPLIGDLLGATIIFLQLSILILAASLFDTANDLPVGKSLMQLIRERGGKLIGLAIVMLAVIIFIGIALAIGTAISGISQNTVILTLSLVTLLLFFSLGFAPALIAFNDIDLWQTVEASAIAAFKNIGPIIALCVILISISIVFLGLLFSSGLIPEGMQQGEWDKLFETSPLAGIILVVLSTLATAFSGALGYVSYRDVFGITDNNMNAEPSSEREPPHTDSNADTSEYTGTDS